MAGEERERLWQEYRDHKQLLKKAIMHAKNKAWKQLCEELQSNVWKIAYKIVCRKLNRSAAMTDEKMSEVIAKLFPQDEKAEWFYPTSKGKQNKGHNNGGNGGSRGWNEDGQGGRA